MMSVQSGPEMQGVCEALYRARLGQEWLTDGFRVPEKTQNAWRSKAFTKSYLRSFLTFCSRTGIDEWVARVEHCKAKKRDPWAEKEGAAAAALIEALQDWQRADWVAKQWDMALGKLSEDDAVALSDEFLRAETLRIAREQLAVGIRAAIRTKGGDRS